MSKRPLRSRGMLERSTDGWLVKLEASHPSFAENTPVDVILWDNRIAGEQNEVEEISRIQQLEPEVVALALASEASLRNSDFAKRFAKR